MLKEAKSAILNNIFWFFASLVVAVLVWFVAKIEANPIGQTTFRRVPISVLVDDGMIISSQSSSVADVDVNAQESVIEVLQTDDITLTVDLRGRTPGTYTEPINVDVARLASADTQPLRITVVIEQEISQQIPVNIDIISPPVNYAAENPERNIFQAEVRGAAADVNQVEQVIGQFDLSDQQSAQVVERNLNLFAVDADGNRVDNVTINPASILVSVNVTRREDVATFTIRPNILFTTLLDGYEFRYVEYEPNVVILNGPPEVLASLGDTIDTEPISLVGRTSDFTIDVALDLPDDSNLINLSETSTVTVDIGVSEETTTLPLENIPIRFIGLPEDSTIQANPQNISVVLAGPVSLIDDLTVEDIQAVIDVNGLQAGTHQLVPQIEILQGQVDLPDSNVTLLPTEVTVTIMTPEAETTPTVESTANPRSTPDTNND